jgi:hypothetical protein
MIVPVGTLEHEVPAGGRGDSTVFDHEGYGVGRRVFAPHVLRELRAPVFEGLIADGLVERVEGEEDRFRWVGEDAKINIAPRFAREYEASLQELVRSGVFAEAIGAIWGRPAAIWEEGWSRFIPMVPGTPTRVHRDGWHMTGVGAPKDHANMWIPLTELGDGDGALAVAAGSHRIPDEPPDVPMPHPVHLDMAHSGNIPPDDVLAPLWRATNFDVGDALLFRPDMVHATTANGGPYLRLAIVYLAQDARLPLAVSAGLLRDVTRPLSDIEWLVLALLTVQPTTPWLARCAFYSRGVIGRLWAEQPAGLVERAFITLRGRDLIEPHDPTAEEDGGIHGYFHATPRGRLDASEWLMTRRANDAHLLSLKLLFCDWLDVDTTDLLADQLELCDGQSQRVPVT